MCYLNLKNRNQTKCSTGSRLHQRKIETKPNDMEDNVRQYFAISQIKVFYHKNANSNKIKEK